MTNYATQYQRALANAFPKVLHFGALWNASNKDKFKPVDAKTIALPTIDTTGRVDGDRTTIGTVTQRHSNAWENKTLTNHRKWNDLIHPLDIDQTNMVLSIQNITRAYNEQHKFPEMDCYLVSKVYGDWTTQGGEAGSTKLTEDNVLPYIDSVMEGMDEANVPQEGRILYVTPQINTLLKKAMEKNRFLSATEDAVSRTIRRVDDLTIESVPSFSMKTIYNFTVGAVVGTNAAQIDMFFVHPDAVLPIQTYDAALLSEPSAVTDNKWVYFEESFEDVFILNRRKEAIAFHTTTVTEVQ